MDKHVCTASDRFDRLESWMEKLAESTDQIITLITETRHNRKDIDDHEARLRLLEKQVARNEIISRWVERLLWVGLIVGGLFKIGAI